jgi:hypothetical protein
MQPIFRKLARLMLLVPVLAVANAAMAEDKTPSGSVTIDETQIMWIVGGDIGGGTLNYQGKTYKFKLDGLKLGGFGVHKFKLQGDVYDLEDVADFAGVYAEAEAGVTFAKQGKGDAVLKNTKGVVLHLKSPSSEGYALDLGVEGVDVRLEQ